VCRPPLCSAYTHGVNTVTGSLRLPTPTTPLIGREREITEATDLLRREDVRYEAHGNRTEHAVALHWLALPAIWQREWTAARTYLEDSIAWLRLAQERGHLAAALTRLGYLEFVAGNLPAARRHLTESIALLDALGDQDQAGFPRRFLGHVAAAQGQHEEAWRLGMESLALNRRIRDERGVAGSAAALAAYLAVRGQAMAATRLAAAAAAALDRHGAATFVRADHDQFELTLAVLRASLGDAFETAWTSGSALSIDEALACVSASPEAAGREAQRAAVPATDLSTRELEVLRLIAAGKSNPEIAETLWISINTVTRHANHIFAKLGVANRTEAAAYAIHNGLVGPE
jgi:serine/threonine-protein kinase PknK